MIMRPESRLAAGGVVCALAIAMLVSVSLVSCEEVGSVGRDPIGSAPEGPVVPEPPGTGLVGDEGGVGSAPTPMPVPGLADYRLAAISAEPEIRVRLHAAVQSITIESAGTGAGARLLVAGGPPGGMIEPGASRALRGAVIVRRSGPEWIVSASSPGGGVLATFRAADGMGLGFADGSGRSEVRVQSVVYPGRMWLIPRSDAGDRAFDVVEHVGLESYLPGVVAKEMYAGWPTAAYQVQAVCARTYALHERARTLAGGARRAWFDVESTERDQAYVGVTGNRAAAEAVRSTRGMVLADGDRLLRAYFSSTCGGRAASAADTWPTGPGFEFNLAGPIQARVREVACQGAPMYRWTVRRDRSELVQRLRAFGQRMQLQVRNLTDLWAIEPLAFNPTGRPSAFKVIEPGGRWFRLSGEQLRLAMNQSVARAAIPGNSASPGLAPTGAVLGAPAEAELVGPAPAAPASVPDVERGTRVLSSDVEITGPRGSTGGAVTISGRGFGHGVGMCQYCAKAFAERGEDWRITVLRFYPGARLVAAY